MYSKFTPIVSASYHRNYCVEQRPQSTDLTEKILHLIVGSRDLSNLMAAVKLQGNVGCVSWSQRILNKALAEFNRWFFDHITHNLSTVSKHIYPSKVVLSQECLGFEARKLVIRDEEVTEGRGEILGIDRRLDVA